MRGNFTGKIYTTIERGKLMENILKIETVHKNVKLELLRELTPQDIAPVIETENSIMFILSLANECNWQADIGEKEVFVTMKLRFLYAPEIIKRLEELEKEGFAKTSLNHAYIMDLTKVHYKTLSQKINYKGCKTPEQKEERKQQIKKEVLALTNQTEKEFYEEVLNKINESIKMLNFVYNENLMLKI